MHQYRVTKFDPKYRNTSGAYMRDDWTDVSDIGKDFNSNTLTHQYYLAVENAYVESVLAFLTESQVQSLTLRSIENRSCYSSSDLKLVNGHACSLLEIADITRAILRSLFWCRLETDQAFLHFGWDYYMYIGVSNECPNSIDFATQAGLFVEEFSSPYLKC